MRGYFAVMLSFVEWGESCGVDCCAQLIGGGPEGIRMGIWWRVDHVIFI